MFKRIILILALICMIVFPVFGQTGSYTSHNLIYCPGYGEFGKDAFNEYNTYQEILDNQVWANKLAFGNYYLKTDINTFAKLQAIIADKDLTEDSEWDSHDELVAILNVGISDGDLVEIDSADVASGEYTRFTTNGLEGRTEAEFKGDFNLEIGTDVQAYSADNAFRTDKLSAFAATTEAELYSVLSDVTSFLESVEDDTAPKLGGNLNGNDKNITGAGSISFTQELDNGSKTANFSVDFATDQKQKVTLTANTITLTLDTTDVKVGNYLLKVVNGGLATLTWASETGSVYFPSGTDPSLTSSGTDIVTFYFDGTDWYGMASLDFK